MPNTQRGATIIELLAVLLLTSLVFLGAYTSLASLLNINSHTSKITKEQDTFVQLSASITRELSRATQIILVQSSDTTQWRYKKDKQHYALTLTKNSSDLLYTLSRGKLRDANTFTGATIALYDNLDVLAENITLMEMRIISTTGTAETMEFSRLYTNQETISITLHRARAYFGADHARANDRETLASSFTVQLDSDDADIETSTYVDRINLLGKSIANTYVPMRTIPLSRVDQIPLGYNNNPDSISLRDIVVAETEMPYVTWYSVRKIAESINYDLSNAGKEGSKGKIGEQPGSVMGAHPVTNITWKDVIVWLNAWSELHGLNPVYRHLSGAVVKNPININLDNGKLNVYRSRDNGYRLPTNNEWEAVARWYGNVNPGNSVSTSTNGSTFYWEESDKKSGHNTNRPIGWFDIKSTQIVRTKNKNGADLYDMTGNVSEMTDVDSLRYGSLVETSTRGGAWNNFDDNNLTVSKKNFVSIDVPNDFMGFRPFSTYVPKKIIGRLDLLHAPERTKKATMSMETEQYTAQIAWTTNPASLPVFDTDDRFKNDTAYVATVTLKPKNGYALANLDPTHFSAPDASTGAASATTTYTTNASGLRTEAIITITYPKTAKAPLNELNINFKPIAGETSLDLNHIWYIPDPNDPSQTLYKITLLDWINHSPQKTFEANTQYQLTAKIEAVHPSISLPDPAVSSNEKYFSITTAEQTTYVKTASGSPAITIVFPKTETTITNKFIQLPKTKEGQKPKTSVNDDHFSGVVTWEDENGNLIPGDGLFEANKKYTAKITLTPKLGYTLYGVPQNHFNVSTAESTKNVENSGIVTAKFREAAATTPVKINISGLRTRAYNMPAKTINKTNNTPFESEQITWSATSTLTGSAAFQCGFTSTNPPYDCSFKPNHTYQAEFVLIFPAGYDTTKLQSDSFVVLNANDTQYDPLTKTITAKFPKIIDLPTSVDLIYTIPPPPTSDSITPPVSLPAPPDTNTAAQLEEQYAYIPANTKMPLGLSTTATDVSLDAFFIGKTEVSYRLWYMIRDWATSFGGYTFESLGRAGNRGTVGAKPTDADQFEPVTTITWRDMIVWLNAYSEYDSLSTVYLTNSNVPVRNAKTIDSGTLIVSETANGYRLPTDAQWEAAARGLGTSPGSITDYISVTDGGTTTYWLKDDYASGAIDKTINSSETKRVAVFGDGKTAIIGSKTPNTNNVYDMTGNVAERTFEKTIRGGHYASSSSDLGVGHGINGDMGGADPRYGFRIAKQ